MAVRHALRPSSPRSKPRQAIRRGKSRIGVTLPFVFVAALLVLQTSSTSAYKVCTDPNQPCFHEGMAQDAAALYHGGGGIAAHLPDLRAGAGGEDNDDHVFGYEKAFPFEDSFVTAPHFWDVDAGANDPVKFVDVFTKPLEFLRQRDVSECLPEGAGALDPGAGRARGGPHQPRLPAARTRRAPGRRPDDPDPCARGRPPSVRRRSVRGVDERRRGRRILHAPADERGTGRAGQAGPDRDSGQRRQVVLPDEHDRADRRLFCVHGRERRRRTIRTAGSKTNSTRWPPRSPRRGSSTISRTTTTATTTTTAISAGSVAIRYFRGIRAIAALYKLFEDTVAQRPTLTVVIDRVEEDEDHDARQRSRLLGARVVRRELRPEPRRLHRGQQRHPPRVGLRSVRRADRRCDRSHRNMGP